MPAFQCLDTERVRILDIHSSSKEERGVAFTTHFSIHHPRLWFWCCLMLLLYLELTKYSVLNTVLQESGRHVRRRTVSVNKLHPTTHQEFFTPLYKMPRIGFTF